MRFRICRPSPALFVAILALVFAMSGVAVAVTHGGDSLITARTLSGNRLRLNTVTGAEVNESKLGQVPKAGLAVHVPALVWHNLTLLHGWKNYNSENRRPPGWAIDIQGIVHLRGTINAAPDHASAQQFAVIDAAARPVREVSMAIAIFGGQENGGIAIRADGTMTAFGTDIGQTSLDGVTYSLH